MQRAKVDIKDFYPWGMEQLQDSTRAWVAIGKHLCGAATDFTLRCCVQASHGIHDGLAAQPGEWPSGTAASNQAKDLQPNSAAGAQLGDIQPLASSDAHSALVSTERVQTACPVLLLKGGHPSTDEMKDTSRPSQGSQGESQAAKDGLTAGESSGIGVSRLKGLAIAPCCHHRCCWEHFVGKQAFLLLGFTPQEFEIVSWMTGKRP